MRPIAAEYLVLTVLLCLAAQSHAQDKSKYYTVAHADEFTIDWAGFYDEADRMTAEIRKTLPHHLDLAYGEHPKQKVDIYLPTNKPSAAPVFVFLHGGGWREGDRVHYGYVAAPFAKNGVVTVVASYRLLPEFKFPDQPNDVRHILGWVFRNIESYGGDPGRIYLAGHSAGAILTADVCLKRDWLDGMSLPSSVPAGCVPISGSYDFRERTVASDYVGEPALAGQASPILNIDDSPPGSIIAVGTEERHLEPSRDLAEKLREMGADVQLLELEGMDHKETVESVGDEKSELFQAILHMIENQT